MLNHRPRVTSKRKFAWQQTSRWHFRFPQTPRQKWLCRATLTLEVWTVTWKGSLLDSLISSSPPEFLGVSFLIRFLESELLGLWFNRMECANTISRTFGNIVLCKGLFKGRIGTGFKNYLCWIKIEVWWREYILWIVTDTKYCSHVLNRVRRKLTSLL